jgi:hypothetical protein
MEHNVQGLHFLLCGKPPLKRIPLYCNANLNIEQWISQLISDTSPLVQNGDNTLAMPNAVVLASSPAAVRFSIVAAAAAAATAATAAVVIAAAASAATAS